MPANPPLARPTTTRDASEPAGTMLGVAVEGGGCSGFQYRYDLTRDAAPEDIVIERDGRIVVRSPETVQSWFTSPITKPMVLKSCSRSD